MSDILLFQTDDGGEIEIINGFVTLTDDLQTAAYISLFGGEFWFANDLQETDAAKIESQTQKAINETPPGSGGLLIIEDASRTDLAWLVTENLASSVDVVATLTGSTLDLEVSIEYDNAETVVLNFEQNWSAP